VGGETVTLLQGGCIIVGDPNRGVCELNRRSWTKAENSWRISLRDNERGVRDHARGITIRHAAQHTSEAVSHPVKISQQEEEIGGRNGHFL